MWPADRGTISQETLFKELADAAGVTPEEIEKDWESHIRFNTELLAYVKELKTRYKIGLVSNATSSFFHTAMALSGAASLFDAVIVSSEVKHVKPEPEIYQAALAALGVAPGDALMIDDSPVNVDGARRAGMEAHCYSSLEDLKKYLGHTSDERVS